MPRKKIEELQLERLKATVAYCYNNCGFYNKRLADAGIFDGSKIKTLSDVKYIPFTTKDDFRENYPFGLSSVPLKDVVRIHASSGTTGKPTVGVYTKNDIEIWSDCVARVAAAGGVKDSDIIQISFGYGLFTGALGLHYVLQHHVCDRRCNEQRRQCTNYNTEDHCECEAADRVTTKDEDTQQYD